MAMTNMMHTLLSIEDKIFIIVMIIIIAYIISIFMDKYSKELEILAFSSFSFYLGNRGLKTKDFIFNKQ